MAHQVKLFRAENLGFVIDKQITSRPEQNMKPAEAFMLNKMPLFKQEWTNVRMQLCIFGDIILFVSYANGLLFNPV